MDRDDLKINNSNEEAGQDFTKRLVEDVHLKSRWYFDFFSIAWTAGPVTYIALEIGHLVAFGKHTDDQVFIYFAIYTIVAGIFALFNKLFRRFLIEPNLKRTNKDFSLCIDRLFEIYFILRNRIIEQYADNEKPYVAAWWSLKSSNADIDVVQEAIRDITQDEDLVIGIKRIESYRRLGYKNLLESECEKYSDKVDEYAEEIEKKFSGLANLLRKRFKGYVPISNEGQKRPIGFLQQLASVGEKDNSQLATAYDALAFIHFTLELLLGLSIKTLFPRFKGFESLENSREKFDELMSDFKLKLRKRNGKMRVLVTNLSRKLKSDQLHPVSLDSQQLRDLLLGLLDVTSDISPSAELLYNEIYNLNKDLMNIWKKLSKQEDLYNREWQYNSEKLLKKIADSPNRKLNVLQVEEKSLYLSDKHKLELMRSINDYLVSYMDDHDKHIYSGDLKVTECKEIALEIMNLLDEKLNILEPEELLAIESSNESDFGCINSSLSTITKIGWAYNMVNGVKQDSREVAYKLLERLILFFNLPLNEQVNDYFIQKFGLSEDRILQLQNIQKPLEVKAQNLLKIEIINLPKPNVVLKEKRTNNPAIQIFKPQTN